MLSYFYLGVKPSIAMSGFGLIVMENVEFFFAILQLTPIK